MFKKEIFDKNILITSRFNDIKVAQSIKTTTSGNQELATLLRKPLTSVL